MIEDSPAANGAVIETQRLTKTFVARQKGAGLAGSVRALVRPRYRETEAVKGISLAIEAGVKTLRLVAGYLRHNLMSAIAYQGAFSLQVFGMALNNTMLLFFWWVLFSQLPTLCSWTLDQVMTLYPAAFVGSLPAALLTEFHWERLAVLAAAAGGFTLLARLVFQWGLRRYESGNQVSVRG